MTRSVLINVGSNATYPNGRGRIFHDQSFEYVPIPEGEKVRQQVPTYRDIGFNEIQYPDLPVHLDPDFTNFTFSFINRGFGSLEALLKLSTKDYQIILITKYKPFL